MVKPGSRLAGFSVLAEVGRGAASTIYLVQDAKTKQIWALKHLIKHTSKDQRFLDQAETEAEVSSKLSHPGIRRVEKCIKNRALLNVKELFLVMEYVDGVSVERHPPKTLERAVEIFHQAALALAHMHERGWVHADMKPNNVVVCEDGSVKVIDLGQSCAIGTVKERIQGTPDYIAPEQVHLRPITPRTDIYNLGATMYWVLTHKNIPTAIPKGDSLVNALDDSLIERPKPIKELSPLLPDMLADVVMQSVEVDPDRRPESMRWVADRLGLIHAKLSAERRMRAAKKRGEPLPASEDETGPLSTDTGAHESDDLDIDDLMRGESA